MLPIIKKKHDNFYFTSFLICGAFMCLAEMKFSFAVFITGFILMFPTLIISKVLTFIGIKTKVLKLHISNQKDVLDDTPFKPIDKDQLKIIKKNYFAIMCIPSSIIAGVLYILFI